MENMAIVPIDANSVMIQRLGASKFGSGWSERYGDQEITQFRGAQLIADKWALSREDLDVFGARSAQPQPGVLLERVTAKPRTALAEVAAEQAPTAPSVTRATP